MYAGRPGRVAVVVAMLAVTGLLDADNVADWVIGVTAVAAIAYFALILSSARRQRLENSRVARSCRCSSTNVVFWALFQQQSTVVSIYSDKRLDRDLFGWTMPVSWVQSINPVFIIVLRRASSPRCGPGWATGSPRRRSSSASAPS